MTTIDQDHFYRWEKYVLSWTNIKWDIPILVIKFEDIVYDKINILNKIINFLKLIMI